MADNATRLEHDLLGDKAVPADAYYGVQTARGLENFHISGVHLHLYPDLIRAFAMVKMAAARANFECGQFSKDILTGIEGASREIIDGKLHDQFQLDMFQGGAGTSTNMNANEVIANRALELMGHQKGEYQYCDPHDHVNASQSTNDAYPSALHVGMALGNIRLVTQDTQAFVLYSSCMKSLAIKLSKVCNDLRLLSSGPRCGLREINLPPKQPGSSIMPGKVNPVIPEVVNMVCFRVIGSDQTISMAAEGGQLQLNVFEPVIAACIFEAQTMFINAARTLRVHCVEGITANPEVCRHYVDYSIGTVTALNPVIGYDRSTELAAEATRTGRGILELIRERKILSEKQIAEVLDPMAMTGQGRPAS